MFRLSAALFLILLTALLRRRPEHPNRRLHSSKPTTDPRKHCSKRNGYLDAGQDFNKQKLPSIPNSKKRTRNSNRNLRAKRVIQRARTRLTSEDLYYLGCLPALPTPPRSVDDQRLLKTTRRCKGAVARTSCSLRGEKVECRSGGRVGAYGKPTAKLDVVSDGV